MTKARTEVVIAGVGGQGTVLAARILADAAIAVAGEDPGWRVRVGETFGAAMRGGSVSSHVRWGSVSSPLVPRRRAGLVIGLEPLEGVRAAVKYVSPGGTVVLHSRTLPPVDAAIGLVCYPPVAELRQVVESAGARVLVVDAEKLAVEAGTRRCANVVMLGFSQGLGVLPLPREALVLAIRRRVPSRYLDVNLEAFELGRLEGERYR